MLQILELIASSPLGAFFVSAWRDTYYAAMILTDAEEFGFNDLGQLLLGGVLLAVLAGIGASLFWRHRRDKDGRSSQFVSIRSDDRDEPIG